MAADVDREPYGTRGGARTTQRRGRMSAGKHETLRDLGPRWLLPVTSAVDPALLDQAFGRQAPRLLEIGGGTGEATRDWARARPEQDVVAVELHRPGIVRLVRDLEAEGPDNVRVVEADALALLDDAAPGTFAAVRVLFPDPWPKRRHVERRLVDTTFVRRVADLLPEGGQLHLATDWEDYADQMRSALASDPRLVVEVEGSSVPARPAPPRDERWRSPRPPRPITAYERRGLDAGRTIVDLVARRRP